MFTEVNVIGKGDVLNTIRATFRMGGRVKAIPWYIGIFNIIVDETNLLWVCLSV